MLIILSERFSPSRGTCISKPATFLQIQRKPPRRPHRTNRMRARRPDSNLKNLKNAGFQAIPRYRHLCKHTPPNNSAAPADIVGSAPQKKTETISACKCIIRLLKTAAEIPAGPEGFRGARRRTMETVVAVVVTCAALTVVALGYYYLAKKEIE